MFTDSCAVLMLNTYHFSVLFVMVSLLNFLLIIIAVVTGAVLLNQDKAVQSVMKVLMTYKASDIDAAVKSLDQTKQDVLMKYIYRGFELSSEGNGYGAQLLVWHDKVVCRLIIYELLLQDLP